MPCDRCGDTDYIALLDFELPLHREPQEFGIQQVPPHAKLCADCVDAVAEDIWTEPE